MCFINKYIDYLINIWFVNLNGIYLYLINTLIMDLTERQESLLVEIKMLHGDQKRKYTGLPYYTHLLAVANGSSHLHELAWEIGLCHDVIEDTDCSLTQLQFILETIGYDSNEARFITSNVNHLTDLYIKEDFPDLNRKNRKELEASRLGKVPSLAQSIKCVDILDNGRDIGVNDPGFANVYFKEIDMYLSRMREADYQLYKEACHMVYEWQCEVPFR
jgi:guanosine-3',5'-bis(diphosphate) 3'-pyrophosphohydrolase